VGRAEAAAEDRFEGGATARSHRQHGSSEALGRQSKEDVVRNKGSVLRAVPMHRLVRAKDVSNAPG
jgi:hypothetical protein